MEAILKNEDAVLEHLVKVSVPDSEIYTNSHCRAAIHYMLDGRDKKSFSFFLSIKRSLKYESSLPSIEYPEEPETDDEMEKRQRAKYLGVTHLTLKFGSRLSGDMA